MEGESAAVLAAEMRGHIAADKAAFDAIHQSMGRIETTLTGMAAKWDSGIERIHTKIEDVESAARHNLNNEAQVSRIGVKAAMEFTQEAHDRIGKNELSTSKDMSGMQLKFFTSLLTMAVGVIAWFADHFLGGKAH